jgi:hypothetical protein
MPSFQPYWGKPAVRNDRGDRGDVGIIRSPVRASILPDCGLLGRIEEGREWLGRLLQLTADATIDRFNVETSTFLAPEIRAAMAQGLRKIGLPEE